MKVKSEREVAQSCPTLATPWTAAYQAPPSMGFSRKKYWSGVPLPCMSTCLIMSNSFATPWTVAHQAPLSMGFPRQEYWSGLPFPSPEDLPNPGIKFMSLSLAGFFTAGKPITKITSIKTQRKRTPVFLPGKSIDKRD